jgi:hypothetical protein
LSSQYVQNFLQEINNDSAEFQISMAEAAYYAEQFHIARQLVEIYFQSEPQRDQLFCRAKVLLALIINYESRELSGSSLLLKKKLAVSEIISALDIAVSPTNLSRYRSLVYNISLSFWEIVRPFMRRERAASFSNEFNQVIISLEKQDDNDVEWRILLLSAAAICADDEKNSKAATDYVEKAINLMEQLIASLSNEEQKLLKTLNDCRSEVDLAMNAFREIEDREELVKKPRKIDPDLPDDDPYYTTPILYPPLEGLAAEGKEKVKDMLNEAQLRRADVDSKMKDVLTLKNIRNEHLIRLHCERIALNPSDAKRYSTLPGITSTYRLNYLSQVQCISSGVFPEKEAEPVLLTILKKLEETPESEIRNETIFDICRFCWMFPSSQKSIAMKYMELARNANSVLSQTLRVKLDICEAFAKLSNIEEFVSQLALSQNLTSSQIEGIKVGQRIEVVKLLERSLTMTVASFPGKYLVVEICSWLWNIIIPLLTKRTRSKVHSALRAIATSLESISVEYLPTLRNLVYHELASCEEAADYAGLAVIEEKKAYLMDYGGVSKPSQTNSDLLDSSRLNDVYVVPLLRSLTIRVDVYGSPPDIDSQSLLWLQQAKESTSRSFIKEMVSKAATLLFAEIDQHGIPPLKEGSVLLEDHGSSGPIDWSLVVLQRGNVTFGDVSLNELEGVVGSWENSSDWCQFSYSLQQRLFVLFSLVQLSHAIQEVNIFQKAACCLLSVKWNTSDVVSNEFLDIQIKTCCLLAESFSVRILNSKSKQPSFNLKDAPSAPLVYAMGMHSSDLPVDIITMKRLAVKALQRGFKQALMRKDIFAVHNVLIYCWNLHLHLFKDFSLFSQTIKELFDLIKGIISSAELILALPHSSLCFDPKLFLGFMNVYSIYLEREGNSPGEALEIAMKGSTLLAFPNLANDSCEACYYKKQLFERAAQLSILNSINGVASGGGKGGKASVSLEPLSANDNPFLTVYSNLSVAELLSNDKVPKEILANSLEKALKLLQTDVKVLVEKEEKNEQNGITFKTKEKSEQRLEMQLECYARISRLKIIYCDYVAAQDIAEYGVVLFQSASGSSFQGTGEGETENKEDDVFGSSSNEEMVSFGKSRIFRWISSCEQYLALALISFFESAGRESGSSALDPSLVSRLQFISLQHLQPCLCYAVKASEPRLIEASSELILLSIRGLVHSDDYNSKVYSIGNSVIDELATYLSSKTGISSASLTQQEVLRDIFLVLIEDLIAKNLYDIALKQLDKAFTIITDNNLQKDLWPARVVCMSMKGMSVLDGLQKLKERDPVLQASVLALFARSTKDIKSKIATYQQAIELLDDHVEKIDYMIELVEVLNSYGFPATEIKYLLKEINIIFTEIEESSFEEIKEWEEGDDEELRLLEGEGSGYTDSRALSATKNGKSAHAASRNTKSRKGVESKGPTSRVGTTSQERMSAPSNNRSRATSRTGGKTAAGKDASAVIPSLPQQFTLKMLEQCCRVNNMLAGMELKEVENLRYLLKAVYYVHRCFSHCFYTLREIHRKAQYEKLSTEEKSSKPFENFTPVYPDYLSFWPNEDHSDGYGKALHMLQVLSNPFLYSFIRENMNDHNLFDLPSFSSFPLLNSTIFYLFQLALSLKSKCLYSFSLEVIAFMKFVLLSLPVHEADMVNRNSALLSLQLLTYQIVYLNGSTNLAVSLETFRFLYDSRSNVFLTVDAFVSHYIEGLRSYYSQKGVIPKRLLDLSMDDLIFHSGQDGGEEQKSSLFQIETSNLQFFSYISVDSMYYWTQSIPLFIGLGQFAVAEQLVILLLFRSRDQKNEKVFSWCVAYYNQLLLLQGKSSEVTCFVLSQREILTSVGDSSLFFSHMDNFLKSFVDIDSGLQSSASDSSYEEVHSTLCLILQLLSDYCVRKVMKIKSEGNSDSKSTLLKENSVKGLSSKVGESILDINSKETGKKSKDDYSAMEIGFDFLKSLYHGVIFYLRFLYSFSIRRVQSILSSPPPSSSGFLSLARVDEMFNDMINKYSEYSSLFAEYCGENNEFNKMITYHRGRAAFDFTMFLHSKCSKIISNSLSSNDIYDKWILDKLVLSANFVSESICCHKVQIERYEELEIFFVSSHSTDFVDNNSISIQLVENDSSHSYPTSSLKSSLLIQLGHLEFEYAKMLLNVALFSKEHLLKCNFMSFNFPVTSAPSASGNVTENGLSDAVTRYLLETAETNVIAETSVFSFDYLTSALHYSSNAVVGLAGEKSEKLGKLLFYILQVCNAMRKGGYENAIDIKVQTYRDNLSLMIKEMVDSFSDKDIELLSIGSSVLLESYGCSLSYVFVDKDKGKENLLNAVNWLFYLQSLQTKLSLKNLWLKAVPRESELLCTLRRLNSFEATSGFPLVSTLKSFETDLAFLKSSVPAIKRWVLLFFSFPFFIFL